MKNKTDYVALSEHIQAKGYKRNANNQEIEKSKKELMAKKMKKKEYNLDHIFGKNPLKDFPKVNKK